MKCSKCNANLNKDAKFCSICGTPVPAVFSENKKVQYCQACNHELARGAKFCNRCGAPQTEVPSDGLSIHNHYVTWHILPGQLALKIDEQTMSEYRRVRGLYIAPGTRALFFVNGKYVASLDSGKYPFRKFTHIHKDAGAAMGFLHAVADHISDGVSLLFSGTYLKKRNFYTVMLVKGAEFSLRFEIDNIATSSIRSTVMLDMLCNITDLDTFFASQLTDRKYITVSDFASQLIPSVTATLNTILCDTLPSQISDNTMLISRLMPQLQDCLQTIYPYVEVKHLLRLTANREEIEELRRGNEDLYIGGEKLDQLNLRNELLNRAQSDEYAQDLTVARAEVDYQKLMDKIDRDRLMNEDTRASFITQLAAERELREARTQEDVNGALDKLCRERILSEDAVEVLKRKIAFQAKEQDEEYAGLIAIAVLRNQMTLDKEQLEWSLERENRIADNKLAREKTNLEWDIEKSNRISDSKLAREKNEFEWSSEKNRREEQLRLQQEKDRQEADRQRRLAELELQQKLDAHKMDLLKQAQMIREQNLQAAHEREMALRKQTADFEVTKQKLALETELEEQRLYLGMTAEQIMVANPRITPEAAAAMAKKFEAEALAAKNNATIDIMQKHNDDLKDLLREQHQLTRDVVEADLRHAATTVEYKQQELERVSTSSKEHEDRLLSGVQTATTSAATVLRSSNVQSYVFCTNCGKRHPANTKVCDACNTPLNI